MKKKIIFILVFVILILIIAGFWKFTNNEKNELTNINSVNEVNNESLVEENEFNKNNTEEQIENNNETNNLKDKNNKINNNIENNSTGQNNSQEKKIVKKLSPSGFMGSSLYKVILYSNGEVYVQRFDGTEKENLISEDLIGKNVTSIETSEDDEHYGEIMVKGGEKLNSDFGWVYFE